jgi:DMSO reductase anchor subunit
LHPAPSIIAFTVLSGLGFGLMAWLGAGVVHGGRWVALAFAALALGLAGAGLLASLAHLGQARRFLKAFREWRTSWLSREAWAACAAMAVFGLYALAWAAGLRLAPLGWLAALLALATVLATSMIYAQMRAVPRWRSPLTPAIFLLASLAGGALLADAAPAARALLAALALAQLADWVLGDRRRARARTTLATATGLGGLGRLRAFEPPHTGANYLTREMVFVIARRHALKLRAIGLGLAALLPLGLALLLPFGHLVGGIAVLSHVAGMVVLRWLFFAEAEHVVGLYYGKR